MNVERVWQKVYIPTGEILAEVIIKKDEKMTPFKHARITDMIETSAKEDFSCCYYEDGVLR